MSEERWKDQPPHEWQMTPPLKDFLGLYEDHGNIWWAIGCGHHLNLFEAAIDRVQELEEELKRIRIGMGDDYGDDPVSLIDHLKADNRRLREEVSLFRECQTCSGTGTMSVLVAVLPPDEREVYEDHVCAECDGTLMGGHARDVDAELALRRRAGITTTGKEGKR